MRDQPAESPHNRYVYWWLLVPVIILLLTGWWWKPRPRVQSQLPLMQPVACIPLDENFLLGGEARPYCFSSAYLLLQLSRRCSPATLSLLDWDMHPRWQVSVPVPRKDDDIPGVPRDDGSDTLTLSPDGHVLALAHRQGNQVRVWSWRDEKMLGEAHFNWPHDAACTDPRVEVSNSGRVWLNANLHSASFAIPMRWWAVDAAQVIEGRYIPSCPNFDDYVSTSLSPNGTVVIICNGPATSSNVADYATIGVHEGRVIITHISTTTTSGNAFTWRNDQTAVDAAGMRIGPKWTVAPTLPRNVALTVHNRRSVVTFRKDDQGKQRYYVLPMPPLPSWEAPVAAQQFGAKMLCSADGRFLLVHETRSSQRVAFVDKLFHARRESEQLALYTAPGRLCAILPLPHLTAHGIEYTADAQQIALSPDGHRVAIVAHGTDGKQALLVYAIK